MKKILLSLLFVFVIHFTQAQLSNTTWTGTITSSGQDFDITFIFKTDTIYTKNNSDGSILDVSKFMVKDSVLTLTKIHGESSCGDKPGKYKIAIADDKLTFTKLEDDCYERFGAIDGVSFAKAEE